MRFEWDEAKSQVYTGANTAKKSSELSRREQLGSRSAEDIKSKPLTKEQEATLERIAARQAADDDTKINCSEIPALTDEQLAKGFRPNQAREYVGVRLDWDVLHWLKSYGPGHSTRINQILRPVMERSTKAVK